MGERARERERTEIKCRARRTENHIDAPQLHSTDSPLVAVSGARCKRNALIGLASDILLLMNKEQQLLRV